MEPQILFGDGTKKAGAIPGTACWLRSSRTLAGGLLVGKGDVDGIAFKDAVAGDGSLGDDGAGGGHGVG